MLVASITVVTDLSLPLSYSLSSGFMSLPCSLFTSGKIHDTVSSLVDAVARMALLSAGMNCEQSGNNDDEPDEPQVPTLGEALSDL
jgi:predicted permease